MKRPRSGRPRQTTPREDRFIERQVLLQRDATSTSIQRQLRVATNTIHSRQAIRNRLHHLGLRSRRPAVRPRLLAAHKLARRAFCHRHARWNQQQWSQVLFSDESRFSLEHNDGRTRVWRRVGERYIDAAVRETRAFGGGSVMVWGAFSLHQKTPLYHTEGSLTGLCYRDEILAPVVVPTMQRIGPMAVFQDDNARPHRCLLLYIRIVLVFLLISYIAFVR